MLNNKNLAKILKEVSKELNLPEEVVTVAYLSFWKFAASVFEDIPFKEINSQEEFNSYRTSINIPSLGKFYTTWDRVYKLRENYKKYLNRNEKE